jgi:hypothetical protein
MLALPSPTTSTVPPRGRSWIVPIVLVIAVALVVGGVVATRGPEPPAISLPEGEILIGRERLMSLPTAGAAWQAMVAEADAFSGVSLADQEDPNDIRLLAWALVTVRTDGDQAPIHEALAAVPGTEDGGDTLALGRNLVSVVLAADLVGYRDEAFVSWLRELRGEDLDGRTLIDAHEDRPNNWGTHAGASRIAADLYLGDAADLARAAAVFRGWLGDRGSYSDFTYGDLDWQADPNAPIGINPVGASIDGRNVDGVLPDDQRRAGGFTWPPQQENYVYEALQGALLQAELLSRVGYPAFDWSDQALLRAYTWLHTEADFPAEADDTWQIPLVNVRYGTDFPVSSPTRPGKNFGFTDWLYS